MMRAMLFSTDYFPHVGGAEIAVRELTNRMPDWEFDLICARLDATLPCEETIDRVRVHRVGFGSMTDKYLLPMLGAWRARQIAGRERVLIWSILASFGGFAALFFSWMRPSSPLLLTLQEGDPFERYEKHAGPFVWLHRKIFSRATAVQAISRYLATWATQMGFRGTPVVIPNGVDVDRFALSVSAEARREIRASWGFGDEHVVMVHTGRLTKKNAMDDLIRSLTYLPGSYVVVLAGDGEDRADLESLVKHLGLGMRVRFLGHMGHDRLPSVVQSADIFVRPSLSEGLGNSFLEAMAAGCPIIGTLVGGIPDFLTDGVTGVACRPRDPASIASAARRIIETPGLKETLVKNGADLVRGSYEWNELARRMVTVMRETLGDDKSAKIR